MDRDNRDLWQRVLKCVVTTKSDDDDKDVQSKRAVTDLALTDTAVCTRPFKFTLKRRRFVDCDTNHQVWTFWRLVRGK